MKTFTVTLRRRNGRFVKEKTVNSKYAAKRLRQLWEDTHDAAHYYVEVESL